MEHQFFNEFKFYLDKGTGYWITTTTPKKRMHIVVWESCNGKVPKGFHIHHRDGNKSNNDLSNLELISAREHGSMHMTDDKRERARKMAGEYRHLTKEWHASKEGREWHVAHGIDSWNTRQPISVVCCQCSKGFSTLTYHSKFCSNKCKSAWRRAQRLDDVTVQCSNCKKEFRKNRYAKSTTCSISCGAVLSWREGNHKKKQ
jgi:uncharacterized CHY-type Zn-finger protein